MSERLGRFARFVPSGRVGLYAALRVLVSPGGSVLMSPVTDDVVLFVVLAAGLRPVMAPLRPGGGSLVMDRISDEVLAGVSAVLSTHLYGVADRVDELGERCRLRGIPLIEDAAHGLHTVRAGRRAGTFGDAAVFSFSKHLDPGAGGCLVARDEPLLRELARVCELESRVPSPAALVRARARRRAVGLARRTGIAGLLRRRGVTERVLPATRQGGHRMPLRLGALRSAMAAGPSIESLQPWLATDLPGYRSLPDATVLAGVARFLRDIGADRDARVEGTAALLASLPRDETRAARGEPSPFFRVPLLVADRDAVRLRLRGFGVVADYVYDPPLDDYAGRDLADPSPDPVGARWWAAHALPIDPLQAPAATRALRAIRPRFV
ncbi:MAG TPA: DegT/DnrJ/EryC1/StrS family aminotransferase, partial [Candidatus Binatus sp.]|nr:DegT/DnrJ/EryC1/StrS family aminotransferase [Candidatus Binatus sp.]